VTVAILALPRSPGLSEIELSGLACGLDLSGAAWLPDERTLLVADLHFEKGSSFARRGWFLPPYDTRTTMTALAEVIGRLDPCRVIALGDSFHDNDGPSRLGSQERVVLADLRRGRDWIWIAGNHDRALPADDAGEVLDEIRIGDLVLRHDPMPGERSEVAGHLHPAAKVVMRGRGVRCRAFLTDGRRMVMPAFGAYAGGLNACDKAFGPLFPNGFVAHLIGETRLYAIGRHQLCGD